MDDDVFDIDLPPDDFLEINTAQRPPPKPPNRDHPPQYDRQRIPNDLWDRLPEDAKRILSAKYKARKEALDSKVKRPTFQLKNHETLDDHYQIQNHEIDEDNEDEIHDDQEDQPDDETNDTMLAHMSKQHRLPPGDIKRMLSQSTSHPTSKSIQSGHKSKSKMQNAKQNVSFANSTYSVNAHVTYHLSKHDSQAHAALVDGGANGGLAGEDTVVLERTARKVDISGINNHQINDLDIVTAAGLVDTTNGPCIVILHQYAYLGTG